MNRLAAFLVLALLVPAQDRSAVPAPISVQRRLALVIGNAAYTTGALVNPGNDARDVSAALRRLDFDVTAHTDLGRRALDAAINDFAKRVHANDLALFYYSGHGLQVQNENYLLPVDFKAESEADVPYEATPASRVRAKLEETGARVRVMILDACRNNPYRFNRDRLGGLAAMSNGPEGTLIAFAASDNQTADDNRGGRNGLYTAHLLQALETPGLGLRDVFDLTRAGVYEASRKKQLPALYDMLIGRLILTPDSGATRRTRPMTTFSHRAALVVGNAGYRSTGTIPQAAADAEDVSVALTRLGFEVSLRKDLDRRSFADEITSFAKTRLAPRSLVLFYYSGHAIEAGGKNYLVPIDFMPSPGDIDSRAIEISQMAGEFEKAGASVRAQILDVCHPSPGGAKGLGSWSFAGNVAGEVRAYACGGAWMQTAPAGERNSLYTSELVAALWQPQLPDLRSLLEQVQSRVYERTERKQSPFISDSILGAVSLTSGPAPQPRRLIPVR